MALGLDVPVARRCFEAILPLLLRAARARGAKLGHYGAEHLSVQNKAAALERGEEPGSASRRHEDAQVVLAGNRG